MESTAVCVFTNNKNQRIKGFATFSEEGRQIVIKIRVRGISKGLHGVHIHRTGDLRQGCKSLCDHYNPHGDAHGGLNGYPRHLGDLGNILGAGVDAETRATIRATKRPLFSLRHIVGRSLVIHEAEDDLGETTHPLSSTTGNSGDRIACGVIGWSD